MFRTNPEACVTGNIEYIPPGAICLNNPKNKLVKNFSKRKCSHMTLPYGVGFAMLDIISPQTSITQSKFIMKKIHRPDFQMIR